MELRSKKWITTRHEDKGKQEKMGEQKDLVILSAAKDLLPVAIPVAGPSLRSG